jgi:DNA-binding NtrC family response regulator
MPNTMEAEVMEQTQEQVPAQVTMQVSTQVQVEDPQQPQAVQLEAAHFSVREESSLREILNAAESEVILRALEHTGWNRKRAAQLLKISYRGLLYKIRSHSLTKPGRAESNG